MKRTLRIELKRGFYSAGFYIGILLMIAAGIIGTESMGIISLIRSGGLNQEDIRFITAAYHGIYAEPMAFCLPIACTLAVSASYVEDLQSSILKYVMMRSTKKRYRWSKILSCVLFGGMMVLISIAALLVIFLILFFPDGAEMANMQMKGFGYYQFFLQRSVLLVLNGCFYSLLGGAAAAFTNSKYMAYAAPFILYYVISTLTGSYLPKAAILNPKEWMLIRTVSWRILAGVVLFMIVIVMLAYSKLIERRWDE